MLLMQRRFEAVLSAALIFLAASSACAQSSATAGTITGKITDPTGALVPDVQVKIENPVTGYSQATKTDSSGQFQFKNVPCNPYHLSVTASGFAPQAQDIAVRSSVPVVANSQLQLAGAQQTVTVEASAENLIERDPTAHTDIDSTLIK